jgi:hypothetical protein
MDLFNCFIADMNLIEIHRIGPKFTWTNKQEVPMMEVLDRVLVSPSWEQMYPLAIVHTLSRCGSDHTPLLVLCAPRLPSSPEDFKTESSWFLDPSLKSEVRRHWPVRRGGGVLDYWHHQQVTLRRFMKGWGANFRGQHKRDKKFLTKEILRFDSREGVVGLSDVEWRERYAIEKQLMQVFTAE